MSKITKRKHVMKEMQTDDFDPPDANQLIVRIVSSRGNNLHEVESAEPINTEDPTVGTETDDAGYRFLVSMPTKFRKNVWVKRGDFVIVEPIDEGDKVKAEIVRILTPQHIREFTKMKIWPEKFTTREESTRCPEKISTDPTDSTDDDDDLFVNTNRLHHGAESNGDTQDSSDSDSEEEKNDDSSSGDSDDNNSGKSDCDGDSKPNENSDDANKASSGKVSNAGKKK